MSQRICPIFAALHVGRSGTTAASALSATVDLGSSAATEHGVERLDQWLGR